METTARVALNATSAWALKLIELVLGFILVPFLLVKLGKDSYGIIGIIGVIVSMSELSDLGLRSGLSRHLLAAKTKGNDQLFNQLVSTGLMTYLGIGTILSIVLFFSAPYLVLAFKIPEHLKPEGLFLVRYLGIFKILLTFVAPPFTAILLSHHRYDIVNSIRGTTSLLRGGLLLAIFTLTGWGIYGYAMAEIAAQLVGLIVTRNRACSYQPKLRILPQLYNKDALKIMFSLGSKMYIFNVARFISIEADPIILSSFMGPSAIALYNPGAKLANMAAEFVDALRSQLWTLTTDAHESDNIKKLHRVLVLGTKYTVLMGSFATAFLLVYAMPIMKIWIGDTPVGEQFFVSAWVLTCWTIAYFFDYIGGTQWSVLLGMNRVGFLVGFVAALAVINVIMSVILVGYTDLGVIGVVIPTVIVSIIRRPIILWHCSRVAGISQGDYLHSAYLRPLAVLILIALSAVVLSKFVPATNIWRLLASATILGLVWIAACWWIGFEEQDRSLFKSLASKVKSKKYL